MKSLYILCFALFITNISIAQDKEIIGKTTKQKILSTSHHNWFDENYQDYIPQPNSIKQLKELFKQNNYRVKVYFGSWCSDSQREIPRLLKLLEVANFNFDHLELVGVGRDKKVPNVSKEQQESLNITNVPTIVVYKNAKELNRFVEYAQQSLEKDMLKIFKEESYKHSYQQ